MFRRIINTYISGLKLLLSPKVPTKVKVTVIAFILFYIALPLDFMPDFLPVIGVTDEMVLLYLVFSHILKKYAQPEASKPPFIEAEVIK